jgi:REP element-mobilizing transposase RayT
MTSLGENDRTADAVHHIGLHLVWCPTYRRMMLESRVAEQTPGRRKVGRETRP